MQRLVQALARPRAVAPAGYGGAIGLAAILGSIGLALGLLIGRWWMLVVVPPAVFLWLERGESPLPDGLETWIAFVGSAFCALGLIAGNLLRRLARRS